MSTLNKTPEAFVFTEPALARQKVLNFISIFILSLSSFGIFMVAIMAFINPQSVMDLVQVKLENTDAYSSIRGVYGGAGLTIGITFIYLILTNRILGLSFASLLWGFYALARLVTNLIDGELGEFGSNWMVIETILCLVSITLLYLNLRNSKN